MVIEHCVPLRLPLVLVMRGPELVVLDVRLGETPPPATLPFGEFLAFIFLKEPGRLQLQDLVRCCGAPRLLSTFGYQNIYRLLININNLSKKNSWAIKIFFFVDDIFFCMLNISRCIVS